jgi:hypothetical protein
MRSDPLRVFGGAAHNFLTVIAAIVDKRPVTPRYRNRGRIRRGHDIW